MPEINKQMKKWMGQFGKEYTDRNALTLKGMDRLYRQKYGITRTALNKLFLGNLSRSINILEAGSNIGNQLLYLKKMGFRNLYGIEINNYAVEVSKARTKDINIIQGSILDIPFKDRYFDLVFTSGVLIHMSPRVIKKAMKEIYRCSRRYIWGFEYYSDVYRSIPYRGQKDLLWKGDFPSMYRGAFPDLKIMKIKLLKYIGNDNADAMFLLKKK